MARTRGALNNDHDQTRSKLAAAAFGRLMQPDGASASMRDFAQAAGVSIATIRHYFKDRDGMVRAAMAHGRTLGAPYMLSLTLPPEGPLREMVPQTMQRLLMGLQFGVARVHSVGLAMGLENEVLGPTYVQDVLEPTLQAFEAHLAHFAARGELRLCSLRVAAIALVSPLLIAFLHQGALGGSTCRPLEIDSFLHEHVARWLDSYANLQPTLN